MSEIDALIDGELSQLIEVLEALEPAQWDAPSLCDGWRVRDVAVHLLMPYELSVPRFLTRLAAAGFRFDTMADRWATRDSRPNRNILNALRGTAQGRFGFPGAPPEAPLSHLVIHAEDIYLPLGANHTINPRSANIVLDQLTSPRARRSLKPGLLDGLAFSTSDTGWSFGAGAEVVGSAPALITTMAGRPAAAQELTGSGAAQIRARLLPAPPRVAPPNGT